MYEAGSKGLWCSESSKQNSDASKQKAMRDGGRSQEVSPRGLSYSEHHGSTSRTQASTIDSSSKQRGIIMATGSVKWFNNAKGYGFINVEGTDEDIFVHYSQILEEGFKTLQADEEVQFELHRGPKGLHASNVERNKLENQ